MIGIQQKSIKRLDHSSSGRYSSVTVTRVSRFSSQMAHSTRQISITEQQQTNHKIGSSVKPPMFSSVLNESLAIDINRRQSLRQNKLVDTYTRSSIPRNRKHMRRSQISSFNMSFNSKNSNLVSTNSWKSNQIFHSNNIPPIRQEKPIKVYQNRPILNAETRREINNNHNHRLCRARSKYCCLASIPIAVLLLLGLVIMFFGLATMNKTTSTTTTSTTSTSTTSTTSTSTTSTTSTTTTSTTSTTTTTTTTTTSSTSTSSTSTSTTSTTSATTTSSTSTSTTSTTSTTTTTANPCGTPTSIGSSSTIYSSSSPSSSYTCDYFEWTSPTTGTVTLAFQLRNDPGNWFLDDVSVSNGTTEMLVNGNFGSGSFSPGWTVSTPSGSCGAFTTGATIITTSDCRDNSCVEDGCGGRADEVSQSFTAVAGQAYYISFWLTGNGGGSGVSATVTLS